MPISSDIPIAVVGLGCVFPGAPDVKAFWHQILNGPTAIRPFTDDDWVQDWYYSADRNAPDRTYCRYGALLDEVKLDARTFRIPPLLAQDLSRTQRGLLLAAHQALMDGDMLKSAKCPPERFGFILGYAGGGFRRDTRVRTRLFDMREALRNAALQQGFSASLGESIERSIADELEQQLRPVTEDESIASFGSVTAARIAKLFNIGGPHMAVDAGYASTLAALQVACHYLQAGDCDAVLAGGGSPPLAPHDLVVFSKLGGVSAAHLLPFDRRADGTLLGEGCGVVLLRRLDDAIHDGQQIYAVIRGIGGATDGSGRALLAPNPKGQVLAMRRAYSQAGYQPETLQYMECHATGTPLGDVTEFHSLVELLAGNGPSAGTIRLGSVKELTGHLRAAAGAAGLIKAALALHHHVLPPQHSFQEAPSEITLQDSPFYISRQAEEWARPATGPRRAGVSAFSFGGISYHMTLEEYTPEQGEKMRSSLHSPTVLPRAEQVAIVGMGGVFPGAENPAQLWQNILSRRSAVGVIPPERADVSRYVDPSRQRKDRPYTDLGGYIVDGSWPQDRCRMPPRVAAQVDRGQSWTMRAALQALDDMGGTALPCDTAKLGLFVGYLPPLEREFDVEARVYYAEFDGRLARILAKHGLSDSDSLSLRREAERIYKEKLLPITEDTLIGYMGSIAASRVAHNLNCQGPAFAVESACASSMAAVHVAVMQLQTGLCDLVLAGGLYSALCMDALSQCCSFGGLSQTGIYPFDARADGYVTSEGAALLALKRLSDAEAAGDRIYGVIRSISGSTDPGGTSIWAPNSTGQAIALKSALEKAQLQPEAVDFIECHGTGTAVGDPVEVESYRRVYGLGDLKHTVWLGSVKSNIGHMNSAAGAVAMIKTALSLHNRTLAPNINFDRPNPTIPWERTPFRVPTSVMPWPEPSVGVRTAAVSSFGLGGTNFHAIVSEYPSLSRDAEATVTVKPSEDQVSPILHLSGNSRGEILDQLQGWISLVSSEPQTDLRRPLTSSPAPCRFAMTLPARTAISEAIRRAERILRRDASPSLPEQGIFYCDSRESPLQDGKVAVLFPGQGPQYANMLRELAKYPVVATTIREADRVMEGLAGRRLSETFWMPPGTEESYRQDDDTVHAAVFVANIAIYRLLRQWGIRVEMALGQSAGEYAALVAGGILPFDQALRAVYKRTLAVTKLPLASPGCMASVSADLDAVRAELLKTPGYVVLAAENAPGQGVIAGEQAAVEHVLQWCHLNGFEARLLPVSHAYHSRVIADAIPILRPELLSLKWSDPTIPVLSSVNGVYYRPPITGEEAAVHLTSQYVLPLNFVQNIRQLYADGARFFIEAGPKWSLTAFVSSILAGKPHAAHASIHPKVGELEQLNRLLAFSYVNRLFGKPVSQ